jgi:predicted HTH transcriptional regulator
VRFVKEDFAEASALKGRLIKLKDKGFVKDTPQRLSVDTTTARRNSISSIVRAGGEMSIRDIAAQLPGYGEKTIQRELNSLIADGSIKRTGQKRWSRYSIAEGVKQS